MNSACVRECPSSYCMSSECLVIGNVFFCNFKSLPERIVGHDIATSALLFSLFLSYSSQKCVKTGIEQSLSSVTMKLNTASFFLLFLDSGNVIIKDQFVFWNC